MKRRVIGQLVEVYEEITTSGNWIPPTGCKSVDAFIVGGGGNGGNGNSSNSGAGGNGGECKTFMSIPIVQAVPVSVVVGEANSNSRFGTYTAKGAAGGKGGSPIMNPGHSQYGNNGSDGVYAFNNPSRFPLKYGAGGGSGAGAGGSSGTGTYIGGKGGDYGAGIGGNSTWILSVPTTGENGQNATFHGAGGGGGGKSVYHPSVETSYGGKGYQGIVILHYYKS